MMGCARLLIAGTIFSVGCVDEPADGGGDDDPLPAADDSETGTAVQELSSSLTLGTTLVTTDNLNLRTGPSTSYHVIGVIPAGTRVSVVFHTSPSGGFYNVWASGSIGWSSGLYLKVATPPAAHTLSTSVVRKLVEPPGSGNDDRGHAYTDKNYWNFCGPGAVTAGLAYFTSNVTGWPAGTFTEPYGPHESTTYWGSSIGRAYLMHVAMQVKPPSFTRPGLAHFATYPTTGANLSDSRDVLNWEASKHDDHWSTFFYQTVSASGLSSTTLHHDIARDVYGGHAVLATVDTAYLPNWSRSLGHSILIVGYDDTAGTYAYIDTCGKRCNGSAQATDGGVWQVGQSRLYHAILAHGAGYAR